MPKIKITGLPQMQFAGECPYGEIFDPVLQQCVPDINYKGSNTVQQSAAPAAEQYDLYGCVIGKETWSVGDQKCVPNEQVEPQKFNTNAKLSGGTPKTGPGTGVNPAANTAGDSKAPKWTQDVFKLNASLMGAANALSAAAKFKENRRVKREFDRAFREANFNPVVEQGRNLGNVETNTGVQFPNMLTPINEGMFITQFGGNLMAKDTDKIKIRIVGGPQEMKYGGQSGYSLDLGWKKFYTEMSKTTADHYTNTMSEDKSDDAAEPVIEAEGGETFIRPEADGSNSFFELEGKRHTDGGLLLTAEQIESADPKTPSFMFSDTKALKIKDPAILEMFNVPKALWKKGVTPAKISKKFKLNEYNAIIKDINSDPLQKSTAQMMLDKNEGMLAKLAAVQESMKGGQLPMFAQQKLMGKAKGGGPLPKFQKAGEATWSKDFEEFKTLFTAPETADLRTALYQKYKSERGKSDSVTEEQYINSLLEGQRQKYVINEKLAGTPELITEEWDKGGANTYYNKIAKKLGLTPQSGQDIRRSQQAFLDMYDLLSSDPDFSKKYGSLFAIEYKGVPEPKGSGYSKEPTRRITKADDWRGNTDIGQLIKLAGKPKQPAPPNIQMPPGKPPGPGVNTETRYVCAPDPANKGKYIAKPVSVSAGAGGFRTAEEAMAFCNRGSSETPFGYTAPDAYNMFASSAVFPRLIMPFVPTPEYEKAPLYLEDPRARVASRQGLFNTQANILGAYTAPQGLSANLSNAAGQVAEGAVQDIANVVGNNINRGNAYESQEVRRRDAIRAQRAAAMKELWAGNAVALQQYDNAIRGMLKDTSKAFDRAWNNRQKFGDINATNTHFFKDPWTGRQIFKPNTAGFAGLGYGSSNSTGSDLAALGSAFNSYYNTYLESLAGTDLSDEKKKERASDLAMLAIRSGRETQRTDKYGNPVGGSSTSFDLDGD